MDRRQSVFQMFAMAAAAATAAEGAPAASWPDAVFPFNKADTKKMPFGETTVYFDGKTSDLKSLTAGTVVLNAGQEPHPPHQHPESEFMFVTEGHGTMLVSGKETPVGPGDLLYCEGNKLHGVRNTGSTPFRFYFFKWLA
jgi:quercetin dioxygenase-like cupin family protein